MKPAAGGGEAGGAGTNVLFATARSRCNTLSSGMRRFRYTPIASKNPPLKSADFPKKNPGNLGFVWGSRFNE